MGLLYVSVGFTVLFCASVVSFTLLFIAVGLADKDRFLI